MLIFQPPVNFCSDKNIQTIFGTMLENFLNYRIDYNLIFQTVEIVVKKIFFRATLKLTAKLLHHEIHNFKLRVLKFYLQLCHEIRTRFKLSTC
jgi:hypothetical protein